MVAATPTRMEAPLIPAIAAMTGLQVIVSMALFAPGVLAPKLGLSELDLGVYATLCFLTGVLVSLGAGKLTNRLGSFAVAALCMAIVATAMGLAATATPLGLAAAGIVIGFAFGLETPASSALLGVLVRPDQRALVFSIRQSGNQFGAVAGSALLPAIAIYSAVAGYGLVAAIAGLGFIVFLKMLSGYDPLTKGAATGQNFVAALKLFRSTSSLWRLGWATVPYVVLQMSLNTFLVTHAVTTLGRDHVSAGLLLATAQFGGLIGRLGWGVVASRWVETRAVIASLGIAMGVFGVTLANADATWSWLPLASLCFVFGLTASGWNGIFLAEVARLAPEGRIAEATGAVLVASYSGLVLGPLAVAGLAALGGLSLAYAVFGLLAGLAGLFLFLTGRRP
ncbi:MAG: MFS transporter [Alphaproteobacteria bacterium]